MLLLIYITAIYYAQRFAHQKEESNRKLEAYKKNYKLYAALVSEIRASQHEYSNRLQTLQALPEICGDYESLTETLRRYVAQYSKVSNRYLIKLMNLPLLTATLYRMEQEAEQKGFAMECQVEDFFLEETESEYEFAKECKESLRRAMSEGNAGDRLVLQLDRQEGRPHSNCVVQ